MRCTSPVQGRAIIWLELGLVILRAHQGIVCRHRQVQISPADLDSTGEGTDVAKEGTVNEAFGHGSTIPCAGRRCACCEHE